MMGQMMATAAPPLPPLPTPFADLLGDIKRYHGYHGAGRIQTLHEMQVAALEGAITDKPGWREKLSDDSIVAKWRAEAAPLLVGTQGSSPELFDFALVELRWKASQWVGASHPSAVEGAFMADGLLTEQQLDSIVKGASQLEHAQGLDPDWHPGSDHTVRDLVHPSLFCFRGNATQQTTGSGSALAVQDWAPAPQFIHGEVEASSSERGLVWLPSEVEVDAEGKARFTSYINNLNPRQYPHLQNTIAIAFSAALPLLSDALTAAVAGNANVSCGGLRAVYEHVINPNQMPPNAASHRRPGNPPDGRDINATVGYARSAAHGQTKAAVSAEVWAARQLVPYVCPAWSDGCGSVDSEYFGHNSYDDESDDSEDGTARQRPFVTQPVTPPASTFEPPQQPPLVDLRGRTLQVIVKMANIELTPAKPEYSGGEWHVEGMLDESIVATAIYYYDEKNVTPSQLAFREAVNEPIYAQDDSKGPGLVYGIGGGDSTGGDEAMTKSSQPRGAATTFQGRCLAWSNTMQHCVQPFGLKDRTRPGHRKILCFFLVNPHRRIPSTATCPPQQAAWWIQELRTVPQLFRLPQQVFEKIAAMTLADGQVDKPVAAFLPTNTDTLSATGTATEIDANGSEEAQQPPLLDGFVHYDASWAGDDMLPLAIGTRVLVLVHPGDQEWRFASLVARLADYTPGATVQLSQGPAWQELETLQCALGDRDVAFPQERMHRKSDVPQGRFMSMAEAKAARSLLMAERGKIGKTLDGASFSRGFSLCEH
jgi:hypothetical protein